MSPRPAGRHGEAGGFTLVEALLALSVTVMLMIVLYSLLVSSRKGMVRGEGKLEYIGEANSLFQSLKLDVQALTGTPSWTGATSELKLQVRQVVRTPQYRTVLQSVTYRLEGHTVHRRIDPPDEQQHRTFGFEKLQHFKIAFGSLRSASFLSVRLTFQIEAEPTPTEFTKVLFLKNLGLDKTWNPLPEP